MPSTVLLRPSSLILLLLPCAAWLLSGCDPGSEEKSSVEQPRADLRCLHGADNSEYDTVIRRCSVGSCSDGEFCNGFETCQAEENDTGTSLVCACQDGEPPCNRTQFCDEENDECVGGCDGELDEDGDGYLSIDCDGIDCNDQDVAINPASPEVCDEDGVDEDCDPSTVGDRDRDGDGYIDADCFNVNPNGDDIQGLDCDDGEASVHPGQAEVCNGVDDNCDGDVDEEVRVPMYEDADGDGFGAGDPINGCGTMPGFSLVDGDCDDDSASTHPAQLEICNGIDDDCDGDVDEDVLVPMYEDVDGDGFGAGDPVEACAPAESYALVGGDCDDSRATLFPGAIRCVEGGQGIEYELCESDETWTMELCPQQRSCIAQPDGTGVCI